MKIEEPTVTLTETTLLQLFAAGDRAGGRSSPARPLSLAVALNALEDTRAIIELLSFDSEADVTTERSVLVNTMMRLSVAIQIVEAIRMGERAAVDAENEAAE